MINELCKIWTSIAFYLDMLFNCRWINFFEINRCMILISCLFTYDEQVLWLLMMLLTFDNFYHRWYGYYHIIHLSRFFLIKSSGMSFQFNYWILLLQQNATQTVFRGVFRRLDFALSMPSKIPVAEPSTYRKMALRALDLKFRWV